MRAHGGVAARQAPGPQRRGSAVRPRASGPSASPRAALAALQGSAGNHAVGALLRRHPVAPADSPAERAAGAFASGAGRPAGVAAEAAGGGPSTVPGSPGRPLEPAARREFEHALGADLSGVRVHDDPAAHAFARRIGARAGTLGSHIYFGAGRYAPGTDAGRTLLGHELVHTLQPEARTQLHRTPETEARLAEIESQLATEVFSADARAELESEREQLLRKGNRPAAPPAAIAAPAPAPAPTPTPAATTTPAAAQPVNVISVSAAEYEAMTGLSADKLPDAPAAGDEGAFPAWPSGASAAISGAARNMPATNWYYRVLQPYDPSLAQIGEGASLLPRPLAPGATFQPAPSLADMTFRHTRTSGNVLQVGSDRVSTLKDLESVNTLLKERGVELARVDVDAARRLGAQFLEQGDVMRHLDEIGRKITAELAEARATGRGKTFIKDLENRMRALEKAREMAAKFGEGEGVGAIPNKALTKVAGQDLAGAVAGEQALLKGMKAFKYGGRVMIVAGVGMSVARIATAPEGKVGRVVAQEAGGWAFSIPSAEAGAALGGGIGMALGVESGPGVVLTTTFGALVGGALGFFGGQEAVDQMYDVAEALPKAGEILADPAKLTETSLWMFGTPEQRRSYYEMRELETGEPTPDPF